ncbi:serine/threonine-protein kinase [Sphaerisporangium rhizosphaerae]|uniref:non-specific serine/threonine protein kinase n=1 Tax=Sphaerisporangium rhizosphaerae TaxID=2269375 RepID=A0ABW2P8F4_9ACTN
MADTCSSGRVVAGRYRLLEPLGQGGMGVVWRAVDELLLREVAVKELLGSAELTQPEREIFTTRTFREARAAGRLSHPGVAAVYDVFEDDGHPWIVMQLVPSRTLGAIVREDGALPPGRVAEIGLQVLAALTAAHEAGVLHRDVKPDNVLVTADGNAVLTDFGIATLEEDSPVTRTGTLVGTPAFIAPERALGGRAERASDLWSLGVTLYFAVEGRSPFQRGHMLATLAAVLYQEAAPFQSAGALAPVIEGLLVKDPAVRMRAPEVVRLLGEVASGRATEPVGVPTAVSARMPIPEAGAGPVRVSTSGTGVVSGPGGLSRPMAMAGRALSPEAVSLPAPRRLFAAAGATLLLGGLVVGGLAYLRPAVDQGMAAAPEAVRVTVAPSRPVAEERGIGGERVADRTGEGAGRAPGGRGSAGSRGGAARPEAVSLLGGGRPEGVRSVKKAPGGPSGAGRAKKHGEAKGPGGGKGAGKEKGSGKGKGEGGKGGGAKGKGSARKPDRPGIPGISAIPGKPAKAGEKARGGAKGKFH